MPSANNLENMGAADIGELGVLPGGKMDLQLAQHMEKNSGLVRNLLLCAKKPFDSRRMFCGNFFEADSWTEILVKDCP
jgi:hypothetical protein